MPVAAATTPVQLKFTGISTSVASTWQTTKPINVSVFSFTGQIPFRPKPAKWQPCKRSLSVDGVVQSHSERMIAHARVDVDHSERRRPDKTFTDRAEVDVEIFKLGGPSGE